MPAEPMSPLSPLSPEPVTPGLDWPDLTPMFMFAKYGEVLEFKAFQEEKNITEQMLNSRDDLGFTSLLWASRNGHIKMAEHLIEQGAWLESTCANGLRSLHHACNNNREGIVKVLLEAHADVNATDFSNGSTPLHYAASRGILNLVNTVLDGGANLKAVNKSGQSALHRATTAGHIGIVRAFSTKGWM